jgi:hypothetical protein
MMDTVLGMGEEVSNCMKTIAEYKKIFEQIKTHFPLTYKEIYREFNKAKPQPK